VTAAVVVILAAFVLAGIVAVAGGGLFALIVLPLGIAVGVWLAFTAASGRSTRDLTREAESNQEFLGPGGPDDR
jgi:hypothetical protein